MSDAPNRAVEGPFGFLNGWADRIVVITLPRAADRQARIRSRLTGLDFVLVEGTDKLNLDRDWLVDEGVWDERRTPRAYRHTREMSLGEIGAALAHRRVYEDAIRAGWKRTVVFEDDVVPREADLAALPAALSQLPEAWDLCWLGYLGGESPSAWDRAKRGLYVALGLARLCRWRAGEALRLHAVPFSANLRQAGLHMCAHAYAVSLEGARKLLDVQTPIAFRADWALAYVVLRGLASAFVTQPKLFDQEGVDGAPAAEGAIRSYIHG